MRRILGCVNASSLYLNHCGLPYHDAGVLEELEESIAYGQGLGLSAHLADMGIWALSSNSYWPATIAQMSRKQFPLSL